MDYFFQRHFRRRPKRQKHLAAVRQPGPAVPSSKARRRSSVGLPSVALAQSRRSSIGLPRLDVDPRRRPSVGLLVASGQKRQSIIELGADPGRGAEREVGIKRGRRGFHHKPYRSYGTPGAAPYVPRGLAVRGRPSKVKSIESHLLGSSMLLASLVQMGGGVKEKEEEEEEEPDVSMGSSLESDGEEVTDEEEEEEEMMRNDQKRLTQAVLLENISPRPLLRPPRCLRRNSSHLLPADSVFQSRGYGVYGRYNRRRSSQTRWTPSKPIKTSTTSPSLDQLASEGLDSESAETDLSSGSTLHKSCSSPLWGQEETIYYDPYLETWENFLSYVNTQMHTHTRTVTSVCLQVRWEKPDNVQTSSSQNHPELIWKNRFEKLVWFRWVCFHPVRRQ